MNNTSYPVEHPTWYSTIRHMFVQRDIDHMKSMGIDLSDYNSIKTIGTSIYGQVASGNMPPGQPWNKEMVQTFLNWMSDGYPKGTPKSEAMFKALSLKATAPRVRKEVNDLSDAEVDKLIAAFEGMMSLDVSDPNSFFVQAGYHWFPKPTYCMHHAPGYNPWHRAFLISFENAMRSIPGCEDVTLPYWDITKPFPELLKKAPFDAYTLPESVGQGYPKGYTTQRNPYDKIAEELKKRAVTRKLERALQTTDWEDFHGFWSGARYNTIIAAHDNGHNSIGPTMADQNVAAFDPVFWFFHCNWDRLFWKWQKKMNAVELNGLLTTIDKKNDLTSYQIFTVPAAQTLPPFNTPTLNITTVDTIDSVNSLGVDYADPAGEKIIAMQPKVIRKSAASDRFNVNAKLANVRVSGLNRLKIPGSFDVHLIKDGETIATSAIFQPREPEQCPNCVKNAIAQFDFELPLEMVTEGKLEVKVEPVDKSFVGDKFPHHLMGNPTVDVHLLLRNE